MTDIPSTDYSETDASNDQPSPAGWPEGMLPSGVNDSARANMGALKRFWNRLNPVKTSAGTTSALTLTYDIAAAAYYDGELVSFLAGGTPVAAATLNVNSLGAKAIWLFGGPILAGAFVSGQLVQVRYKSSDNAFHVIPQNGLQILSTVTTTGGSTFDFPGIPTAVKHLRLVVEGIVGTNAAQIGLRTYGADGVIDTGVSDYVSWGQTIPSDTGTATGATSTTTYAALTGAMDNSTVVGFTAIAEANDIQASRYTIFDIRSTYADSAGVVASRWLATGERVEAARISGVRVIATVGNVTGYATLYGSA